MMRRQIRRIVPQTQDGYTLPELLVTLIMTALFVELIMMFTFSYWRYGYMQEADLDTLTTRLNAGDILREYLSQSSGLISQNSIADTHTTVPDPAIVSNKFWTPIHATPSTITATTTNKPLLYFRKFSQAANGSFILNGSLPFEDEYMMYLDGAKKKVLLRTLASSASGNRAKSSCPAAIATLSCPADKLIADDIASVDVRFFSRAGNLIDYSSIKDPSTGASIGPDFPVVEVVELTLNLSKKPVFQKTNSTKNSTIIRIALRNT